MSPKGISALESSGRIYRAMLIGALAFASPKMRAASPRPHPVVAKVRFLATSTSTRSTYAGSEDVYLAEVAFPGRTDDELPVRLIDDYPEYRGPIGPDVLQATHFTRFRLLRDATCDIALADMPLRTAPGDPMAILPVELHYQPELPHPVQSQQILPCYRIVRR